MAKRELLLGDEALALGALHAGLSGVYAYPGTPSTEITEYIQGHPLTAQRGIHCTWSANEKTAMEEALGMSFAGKRALVCMKHVGMNVAADAFVNSAMTGANGGLVVVAADDPSMHSSQNEQDSRFYGKFALVPTFEPSTQQEAYEMVQAAFDFSEKYRIPVLMRLTTRMAHSRAMVEPREARPENSLAYPARTRQWVLMPGNSRVRYEALLADYARFEEEAAASLGDKKEPVVPELALSALRYGVAVLLSSGRNPEAIATLFLRRKDVWLFAPYFPAKSLKIILSY